MVRKIEFSAKTIDAALDKAASELKIDRDDLSYEVLQLPKRGFLGMGALDAKIAVKLGEPEEEKPAPRPAPRFNDSRPPRQAEPAVAKPREQREPRESRETRPQQQPRPDNRPPKPAQSAPRPERTETQPKPEPKPRQTAPKGTPAVVEDPASAKGRAILFLSTLIKNMGINAQVEILSEKKDELELTVTGESLGLLIGHHGEILDSLQYLVNLAANKAEGEYLKVTVDIESYRSKREVTLKALAIRMADKVKKYKKNITLEPMNSYERRIIHSVIQDIPGVTTYSVGVDSDRKIVVALERPGREKNPEAGKPRSRRSSAPAAESAPAASEEDVSL